MNPPTSTLPLPHGPLARFLHNPTAILHQLAHRLGHDVLTLAIHYVPALVGLAAVIALARVAFVRWHSRRGATASASYLEVLPPPSVEAHGAEAFWANVHPLLKPDWRGTLGARPKVAFEIRSTGHRVHFGLWAPPSASAHVGRAVAAAWPGSTVVSSDTEPQLTGKETCVGRELRLARATWFPIATDHALDPLRSVLGAAAELTEDESAVIQVVARPAGRRCLGKAQRGRLNMQGIPTSSPVLRVVGPVIHGLLDLVTPGPSTPTQVRPRQTGIQHPELPAAREKVARPCFEASVRVVVSSVCDDRSTTRRLRNRSRALCASFGSYAAENHLVPHRLPRPAATLCSRRVSRCDLYSVPELAALAHLPLDRDVPGLARAGAKRVSPPPDVGGEGRILGDADAGPLAALRVASASGDDAEAAKTDAARKRLAECNRRLTRYRAALDSGADPSVVTTWIAEVQAERLAAEVELERATGHGNGRLSRDQLAALVNGLGNLLDVLAHAAPQDKAEVYRQLGLRLTYDPARRVVIAESDPWAEVSVGEPIDPKRSPGAAADPVGKSQCRRGDLNPHALAGTSPSSWRVCLFRHSDGRSPRAGSRPEASGERTAAARTPLPPRRSPAPTSRRGRP